MWWAALLNVIAGQLSTGTVPSTNSYESIATVTVGAGGSTSIAFSSIPSTYKHLQIRGVASANVTDIAMYYNGDTAANYSLHYLYGSGSAAAAGSGVNQTYNSLGYYTSASNVFSASVCDILDYSNTNKYKTIRSLSGNDTNGGGLIVMYSGNWRSTSAINSINIYAIGGGTFNQYTQFALYGIKG